MHRLARAEGGRLQRSSGRGPNEEDGNPPGECCELVRSRRWPTSQEQGTNEPMVCPPMGSSVLPKCICGRALVENGHRRRESAPPHVHSSTRVSLKVSEPLCVSSPGRRDDQRAGGGVSIHDLEHDLAWEAGSPAADCKLHESLAEQPPQVGAIQESRESEQPPQGRSRRVESGDRRLQRNASGCPGMAAA